MDDDKKQNVRPTQTERLLQELETMRMIELILEKALDAKRRETEELLNLLKQIYK